MEGRARRGEMRDVGLRHEGEEGGLHVFGEMLDHWARWLVRVGGVVGHGGDGGEETGRV